MARSELTYPKGVEGFVNRLLLVIPLATMLIGTTAACSDKATGLPLPETTTQVSTGASGGPFPTGSPKPPGTSTGAGVAAGPLKDTEPCSLLSAADTAQLGAGQGHFEQVGEARACRFTEVTSFKIDVAIYDGLGMDDITANGQVTQLPDVGKHKAAQWMGAIRACVVTLGLTRTSRVDVQGIAGTDTKKACDLAMQAAKLVEARLP